MSSAFLTSEIQCCSETWPGAWASPFGSVWDIPSDGGTLSTDENVRLRLSHWWLTSPFCYCTKLIKEHPAGSHEIGGEGLGIKSGPASSLLAASEGWPRPKALRDKFDPLGQATLVIIGISFIDSPTHY